MITTAPPWFLLVLQQLSPSFVLLLFSVQTLTAKNSFMNLRASALPTDCSVKRICTSWGSACTRRLLDSQQGASTCRCGGGSEPPDPLHSWTCIISNQLRVNGYHAIVRVSRSQWILTETLQATKMNINQHMCYVGRNTLENVAEYHLGGKPVYTFISHQCNCCWMGAGCCIPCSQQQLERTLNITANLTTELWQPLLPGGRWHFCISY